MSELPRTSLTDFLLLTLDSVNVFRVLWEWILLALSTWDGMIASTCVSASRRDTMILDRATSRSWYNWSFKNLIWLDDARISLFITLTYCLWQARSPYLRLFMSICVIVATTSRWWMDVRLLISINLVFVWVIVDSSLVLYRSPSCVRSDFCFFLM